MANKWNGLDLQTEWSTLLSDTTSDFKLKVLDWINDGMIEIASSYDWPYFRTQSKKVLTASANVQDLDLDTPTTLSAAIAAGGSLTNGSTYEFRVTFYESSSKRESLPGPSTAPSVTADASNKTADLTNIPVSSDPNVTERRIYMSKDSGDYLLAGTVSDNTTTTASITSEPASTAKQPPDYSFMMKFDGNLYKANERVIEAEELQNLIKLTDNSTSTSSVPDRWAVQNDTKVYLYPAPSSAITLDFWYYRLPERAYAVDTEALDFPIELKDCLKDYVLYRGYEYRDRDGQESKRQRYQENLERMANNKKSSAKRSGRVPDVMGGSDGFAI